MGTEVDLYSQTIEKIHSVPPWVTSQLALVSGTNRETPLPVLLNVSQQNILRQKIQSLSSHLEEKPDDLKTLALALEFLWATSSVNFPAKQLEAKGWSFVVALRKYPEWCIAESINRWYSGDVPFKVNFGFPNPADLKRLCDVILEATEGRRIVYERMLNASHQETFSEVHQTTMLEKIKGLFTGFNKAAFEKRQGKLDATPLSD